MGKIVLDEIPQLKLYSSGVVVIFAINHKLIFCEVKTYLWFFKEYEKH